MTGRIVHADEDSGIGTSPLSVGVRITTRIRFLRLHCSRGVAEPPDRSRPARDRVAESRAGRVARYFPMRLKFNVFIHGR
jgi:hypothetical protein